MNDHVDGDDYTYGLRAVVADRPAVAPTLTVDDLQMYVERMYVERGYTTDLMTLTLILCEEAGEIAGAVNNRNPFYKQREGRSQDTLEHELKDALVALCAVANSAGIFLADLFPHVGKGEL